MKKMRTFKNSKKVLKGCMAVLFFVCGISFSAFAAQVVLDGASVADATQDFTLTVRFSQAATEHVSALDFTLTYDNEKLILNTITPALNLEASGKQLDTNEDTIGTVKGIIYGLNGNDVSTGDLFTLGFSKVSGVSAGDVAIALSGVHASTSTATAVTVTVTNGTLTFAAADTNSDTGTNGLQAPTILNNEELLNTNNFTLKWTDESASGATSYVVTRMQKPASPLDIPDGLVSYWPMNEASGAAIDSVSGNNLQPVGTVLGSSDKPLGIVPGSRSFGSGSHFELSNDQAKGLDFDSQMTWSAWVKPREIGNPITILSKWNAAGENKKNYSLRINESGKLEAVISSDGIAQSVYRSVDEILEPNVWKHVALTTNVEPAAEPFEDVAGNRDIGVVGDVTLGTMQPKVGSGYAQFNGAGYLSVPNDNDLDFGKEDFTIDFWFKFTDLNSYQMLVSQSDKNKYWYIFYHKSSKTFNLAWLGSSGWNGYYISEPIDLTANEWTHFAFSRDGATAYLFINGKKMKLAEIVAPFGDNDLGGYSTNINIGAIVWNASSTQHFCKGGIDEFRISKGIVRWKSDFTPSTQPYKMDKYTKFLMHFGGSNEVKLFIDGNEVHTEEVEGNVLQEVTVGEPLRIGAGVGASDFMDGNIADIACWDKALSAEEIKALSFADKTMYTVSANSLDITDLLDQNYLFTVQSSNDNSNVSDYSSAYSVTIDTLPPVQPVISTTQSLFALRTVALEGTCSSDTAVLTVTSKTATIKNIIHSGTQWSAEASVVDDGVYDISVIAEDAAGNLSTTAGKLVHIDTTAPIVTLTTPTMSTYIVPRKNVYFAGSINEQDITSFTYHFQTTSTTGDVSVPVVNGNFSFDYTLARGLNELVLTIVDAAGNKTMKQFDITYANDLPLVFDGLGNKSADIDTALSFTVNITNQNEIDNELLTYSVSGLPGNGTKNSASFDPATRQFSWTPTSGQCGLYTVTFTVTDGLQTVSKDIKIVVRNYDIGVMDLSQIVNLPQDKQVVVEDFNKDGYDDIFMVMQGANKFYRNLGTGEFVEEAESVGVQDPAGMGNCAIALDINGDGWMDIYVVNDGANKLFVNNQDGTFSDMTDEYGVGDVGCGQDVVFTDLNRDSLEDLYVVNDGKNILYINTGNGNFVDETDTAGVGDTGDGVSVCAFDANSDNNKDIFIVNNGNITFFISNGDGTFSNAQSNVSGPTSVTGYRGIICDVNFDGITDICLINASKNIIYQCDGKGNLKAAVFNKVTLSDTVYSKSAFYIDYDNDGNLDLFVIDATSKYVDGIGDILFKNDGDGNYTDATAIAGLL